MLRSFYFRCLLLLALGSCQTPTASELIPASHVQTFVIEGGKDAMVITKSGALLSFPACAFSTTSAVVVNFTEVYNLGEFAALQLSTSTEDGQLLASSGMFYLDARNEQGVGLDFEDNCGPILHCPSKAISPGAQLYTGKRTDGQLVWENTPQPLANWLIPVPLNQLHFYAPRLSRGESMGYRDLYTPPKAMLTQPGCDYFGINDNIIDSLYASRFEHSFVATLEFEQRIQQLHEACYEEGIDVYLSNLNRPLYYSDSLVHLLLKTDFPKVSQNFYCFYLQRKTTVENSKGAPNTYLKQWKEVIRQREKNTFDVNSSLYHSFVFPSARTWCNIDRVLAQSLDAKPFEERVVLSCDDLLPEELQHTPILCITSTTNAMQMLTYQSEKKSHALSSFINYTTDDQFILFAYAQKGEQVYAASKSIRLGDASTEHQLQLKQSSLDEVVNQLSQYGAPSSDLTFFENLPFRTCCQFERAEPLAPKSI